MRPHETHLWVQEGEQEEGGQSTGHGRAAKEQGGGEEEERLAEEKWPELGSPDISGPGDEGGRGEPCPQQGLQGAFLYSSGSVNEARLPL